MRDAKPHQLPLKYEGNLLIVGVEKLLARTMCNYLEHFKLKSLFIVSLVGMQKHVFELVYK